MHCYILFAVKGDKIENWDFQSGNCADAQSSLIYEKPLKRQNERKYAYYLKSFLHGSDLRTAHGADKIRYYPVWIKRRRGTSAGELRISALTVKKAYDKLEEEGFVTTVHGKGTYVSASDKQLALEARQKAIEDDFDKVIDRALSMGMKKEEISEVVKLILDEK